MMIQLQTYDAEIIYLKGKEMHLADALSRAYFPLKDNINNTKQAIFEKINRCSYLPICDERLRQIRRATEDDESLQLLKTCDPHRLARFQRPYKGERVVIPQCIRRDMLKRIHSSHIGVEGCLKRARVCLYWPRMSTEVKRAYIYM